MARLSSQANLGFVPLPRPAMFLIASFISAPDGARVGDPCCGEGEALNDLCCALGVNKQHRFANELHDARAEKCTAVAGHVVSCDTLKSLQATRGLLQLAYLNPPFDTDGAEEGGGRLEPKFFRRVVEDGHWVQPGGLVIIVIPQDVLARRECCNHLARCYDDIQLFRLPDDIRHYREAVVFGVVCANLRIGPEQYAESNRLAQLLNAELPVLEAQTHPSYIVPKPLPLKKIVWRDASRGNATMAQQDVIATGGAWNSKKYRAAQRSLVRTQLRPLFPLNKPQAALRIANGAINGVEVELAGCRQRIKGATIEDTITWTEERENDKSYVTETHTITRRVPHVTTIDDEGTIRCFVGDKGMATLMNHDGAAQALLEAVETAASPRYRLDMEPELAQAITGITPASGRALPGYAPGLLPMQRHVVAAAYRALTTPDDGWGGIVPKATVISAEMGVGKTSIGLAVAEILRLLTPTNT